MTALKMACLYVLGMEFVPNKRLVIGVELVPNKKAS